MKTEPTVITEKIRNNLKMVVTMRHEIARIAFDGDCRFSHWAIGEVDGDINEMAKLAGLPLVHRAESDSDIAVYSNGFAHILVADANGPVAISV